MNPFATSLLVFVCAFGGAMLGMFIRRLLPEHDLGPESKEVVRAGMGLVATTVALVLGLLVFSAKSFFDSQTTEVTQIAANVVLLDRILAHYGPESADARAELQRSVSRLIDVLWSQDGSPSANIHLGTPTGEALLDKIQELSPKDERQRSLQSQALSLVLQTGQTRFLIYEQRIVPVPTLLLILLIFWLIALFISFGLFAPPNLIIVVSLSVASAAICGAVFLIVEMYYPYGGLIQVSPAPLRAAIAQLGR
jgi:hypothetical protein